MDARKLSSTLIVLAVGMTLYWIPCKSFIQVRSFPSRPGRKRFQVNECFGWVNETANLQTQAECDCPRRRKLGVFAFINFVWPLASTAAPLPRGTIEGSSGKVTRVEGVGGGFDLQTSFVEKGSDVVYPPSMVGEWKCRRTVVSSEGNVEQAWVAWNYLRGVVNGNANSKEDDTFFSGQRDELYDVRFMVPSSSNNNQYEKSFVVLDRGFEMESRRRSAKGGTNDNDDGQVTVTWDERNPEVLSYNDVQPQRRVTTHNELCVVFRKVEPPSSDSPGFGFNELVRITSTADGFGKVELPRAVRVQRRYRRAYDEEGNRIVEGLEILKTYRVLDGIAGVEMPTSTTKSKLRLSRN